jgi:hypothetical protein
MGKNKKWASPARNIHAPCQPVWPASRMQNACWHACFLFLYRVKIKAADGVGLILKTVRADADPIVVAGRGQ